MNPHFVFNCINSIQQYILTNNKEKALVCLTDFASLIRQTLEISGASSITVSEEVRYLEKYLTMERIRFAGNFTYSISVPDTINANFIRVPSMILQPYVENCVHHGIRHKQNGKGMVSISFYLENDVLFCCIRDNGVGRAKSQEFKNLQTDEHQSRGMNLTKKRIDLLNMLNKEQISIQIIDLTDGNGASKGTEVVLKIPAA